MARGTHGLTLVKTPPFPNTKEASRVLSEVLERRGFTPNSAKEAYDLFRELAELGMSEGLFLALVENLEGEDATPRS